jgi:hypothetical protein
MHDLMLLLRWKLFLCRCVVEEVLGDFLAGGRLFLEILFKLHVEGSGQLQHPTSRVKVLLNTLNYTFHDR